MEIKKYDQFVNEAKKDDAKEEIVQMLKKKPTVTKTNNYWPTEKGIYSQAAMISYLKDKYTNHQVLGGLHDLNTDKKSGIKSIMVRNYHYKENYPYYYMDMTEEEAKKVKDSYEEKNEIISKEKKKVVKKEEPKKEEPKKEPKKASKKEDKKDVKKATPKKRELKSSK